LSAAETATLADCTWHEPGGRDAALAIGVFLAKVGIEVRVAPVSGSIFLPGLTLVEGSIVIDPTIACFPGDVLHEAGHLAVVPAETRAAMSAVENDGGDEMAAIAWSVAACRDCGLPLEVLFHPAGYKGDWANMVASWNSGQPFGVPLLAWYGMTSAETFPAMTRWLR
jgi:hypothetical protein